MSDTPRTYVSNSEGRWRVIHNGMPLCADTDKAVRALDVYGEFVGEPAIQAAPLYNGDRDVWDQLVRL